MWVTSDFPSYLWVKINRSKKYVWKIKNCNLEKGETDLLYRITSTTIKHKTHSQWPNIHTQMLCHLQHQSGGAVLHLQGVEDGRQLSIELHVHHSTDHSHDLAIGLAGLGSSLSLGHIVTVCSRKIRPLVYKITINDAYIMLIYQQSKSFHHVTV